MKQISSLDLHFLVMEIKGLEGARVDRVYNNGKEEIYLQFHKSNVGKKLIRIIIGKAMFLTEAKNIGESPSGFCALLRKHLEGKFFDSLEQVEPERIAKLTFKSKEEEKILYLEFFGKGNLILCNGEGIILDAFEHHRFKDRSLLPREKYAHPKMPYSFFDLNEKQLLELFKNSRKDKLVISLAAELGLGGTYSEEVCLRAGVDKTIKPTDIEKQQVKACLSIIKKLAKLELNPIVIYKDNQAVDATPIELSVYRDYEKKEFSRFSESLEYYFNNEAHLIKKESQYAKKINEIKRIIGEQENAIKDMQAKEEELRKKGEIIYNNYQLVNEILTIINKSKEKYSWEEIKEKLKGHKIVKEVNSKERKISVEVD